MAVGVKVCVADGVNVHVGGNGVSVAVGVWVGSGVSVIVAEGNIAKVGSSVSCGVVEHAPMMIANMIHKHRIEWRFISPPVNASRLELNYTPFSLFWHFEPTLGGYQSRLKLK